MWAAFGHSGDILATWETLQFLPYYSATASNVLYSYIAHDVGGHRDYGGGNDPELCDASPHAPPSLGRTT